jgi:hypothetical protein
LPNRSAVVHRLGARRARGVSKSIPPTDSVRRGRRAEKRKPYGVRDPFGITAGASRRATRGVFCVTHRAPLSVAGYGRSVSQLLAGTRIGPGGSPGAARVPGCEPDARAPRPVPLPQRLARAPFERTRWGESKRGLADGDKAGIARNKSGSQIFFAPTTPLTFPWNLLTQRTAPGWELERAESGSGEVAAG